MAGSIPKIVIAGACERDIDLLLLEEFVASPDFVTWFASAVGVSGPVALEEAARSVTTSNGESDLEITVRASGKAVRLLVENKVDAAFQPRQAERYRERADTYINNSMCDACVTVLVAPDAYFGGAPRDHGFNAHVRLEAVRDWMCSRPPEDERLRYKATLLDRTLARAACGWVLVPDAHGTTLWQEYWNLAEETAPELQMPEPGVKLAGSNFVYFRPEGLPKGTDLVHKMPLGRVDLQFAGMSGRIADLRRHFAGRIEPGMKITAAGKSAVVRVEIPRMNCELPFSELRSTALQGIWTAAHLLHWYLEHPIG